MADKQFNLSQHQAVETPADEKATPFSFWLYCYFISKGRLLSSFEASAGAAADVEKPWTLLRECLDPLAIRVGWGYFWSIRKDVKPLVLPQDSKAAQFKQVANDIGVTNGYIHLLGTAPFPTH
jgi:hypothetical protein